MPLSQTAIFVFNLDVAVNQSMGATFNTDSVETKEAKTIAIQATWSGGGSPVGNMEIQGSLDNVNFTRIQGTVIAVSGNSGSNGWNIQNLGFAYIRLRYVRTSGTATVNVKIAGKTI